MGTDCYRAATVFMAKDVSRKVLDGMPGFAGGVMIAASYWSLLAPAIEMSAGKDIPAWFPRFSHHGCDDRFCGNDGA